jgi:GNAT superfamily N-acetyltransferase
VPVASATLLIVPNLTRGVRPYALIENVVTDPAWRQRGIATYLLRAAQQMAWDANCYKVMLLTGRNDDGTLHFYLGAGFRDDEKTGFVARPGPDVVAAPTSPAAP